jgi:phosphatidylglycerophosphate synthase
MDKVIDLPTSSSVHDGAQRRPIKSRSLKPATVAARTLVKLGVTPNQVSLASIAMAALGALALAATTVSAPGNPVAFEFLLAAIFIQLRLVCNLLDGMMAVECGKATSSGELYNEIPDRISDTVLLAAAGYTAGCSAYGGENFYLAVSAGWLAATLALFTAYVRAFGARYMQKQDFCGPMAKPHRMAALTIGSVLAALQTLIFKASEANQPNVLLVTLLIICVGSAVTVVRRTMHLKKAMENESC